jgi:hypothetical protein
VKRFVGKHAARHAGTGAVRWTAGCRVVPTMPAFSRHRAPHYASIDSLAPQGEAKAP